MLALKGTHQHRLTAGYFVQQLEEEALANSLSKKVLAAFPDELDTVAVYLPGFMPYPAISLNRMVREQGSVNLNEFYTDEAEARRFYDLLRSIRSQIKKKMTFDPCIFPWHKAVLEKAQFAERLCVTARLLDDDALLDEAVAFFPECEAYQRDTILTCCFGRVKTAKQRRLVLESICDKGEYCRKAAMLLADQILLTADDYLVLEGLLRYKYADARTGLILLLQKQDSPALMGSIRRLLADKAAEKRLAALDIIKQVAEQPRHAALCPDCAELLANYTPIAADGTIS